MTSTRLLIQSSLAVTLLTAISDSLAAQNPSSCPIVCVEEEPVYMVVEQPPTPQNGMDEFYAHIKETLRIPAEARRKGIRGKVFVQLVVEKDGTLGCVQAIKGIGGGCDQEAVNAVRCSPAWIPAQQQGQVVRVRKILPISFNRKTPVGSVDTTQYLSPPPPQISLSMVNTMQSL